MLKEIYRCKDYIEYESRTDPQDGYIYFEGYRLRLTDNGIYKPGNVYGRITGFVSKVATQVMAELAYSAFKQQRIFLNEKNSPRRRKHHN